MNKNYSRHNLRRRVRWLRALLDLDRFIDGEKNSGEEIISYYRINDWAYRHFHSQDGFMHFRISKTGTFADEDVYYQPDMVARYIPEGGQVLELGFGQGANISYLARSFPTTRFTGVDLSQIRKEVPRNVTTVCQDYSSLKQFADNTFDVVYAFETIVHNTDKDPIFEEVFRVLKPGGVFIVYDYALPEPYETLRPEEQTAVELISKCACCPLIESDTAWESHFERAGFHKVHVDYLDKDCLPDLKRLERKAEKILNHPGRTKLMYSLFPDMFTANIIIGYLGYDACNAGICVYGEWIYRK